MDLIDTTPIEAIGCCTAEQLAREMEFGDEHHVRALVAEMKLDLEARVIERGGQLLPEGWRIKLMDGRPVGHELPPGTACFRLMGYATWPGAEAEHQAAREAGEVFP